MLMCECGRRECRETVSLSQAALEEYRRSDRPVLAAGHTLDGADETGRSPKASTQDVQAHTAQATPQPRLSSPSRGGRVLAIDDSEIFLRVADSVVSGTSGLQLVGTAASGEEALRLLPDLEPDLVLLDVHMPGIDGLETADRIRRESPQTVVVLVSAEPDGLAAAAESVGAVGVVDKMDLAPDTLDELWLKHGSSA
jgi:two-component system, NarL family, invasion response regulator UvrY